MNDQTPLIDQVLEQYQMHVRQCIDLTQDTDDPGNTQLIIYFITYDDPDDETYHHLDEHFQEGLTADLQDNIFNEMGDHSEEMSLMAQNNELILIVNNNK